MPLPTYLTVASLLLQAGAALIIACVFVGLKRRYWRPFLTHWTWSWLALGVYATLRAATLVVGYGRSFAYPPHVLLSMASGVAGCLQLGWLLLGTYELTTGASIDKQATRRFLVAAAVIGALLQGLFWWDPANAEVVYHLRVTVRRLLVAGTSLVAARALSRTPRNTRAIGRRSVMLALFGLALHQVHFLALGTDPVIRRQYPLWIGTLGLLDAILYFGLAMGLVIWLLEEERQATMDAAAKIEKIAYHDSLTGLPNRQLFLNQMGMALHRARRTNTIVAVLFLDLDRFKVVNDSLGHAAGDLLLQTVSERIRSAVRGDDSVTRLGGDEFAVLCPAVDGIDDLTTVARRIIDDVSQPISVRGVELQVGASIGIATSSGGLLPDQLVDAADRSLYLAKAAGRGRWHLSGSVADEGARDLPPHPSWSPPGD